MKISRKRFVFGLLHKVVSLFIKSLLSSKYGRKLFYKSFPPNTLLIAETPTENFIVNTSDNVIGLDTYVQRKAFESFKFTEVCDLLPESHSRETIVDIGANIGIISIHAIANEYFKDAVAFEPEPQNYHLLKCNVVLNNLEEYITLHNLALSDNSNDFLEFELSYDNHGDHRVHLTSDIGLFNEDTRSIISVKSDTLDNYSDNYKPDTTLIWIDTQGYEAMVLSGASKVISKKIPICMEFWPYGLKRVNGFEKLLDILSSAPYEKIIDLDNPEITLEFNSKNLIKIANKIGNDGNFTDILIL